MIAFSKEATESRDNSPQPILIVGPQIITRQTTSNLDRSDASASVSELVAAHVAREQQELATLQRAIARCGLIGNHQNNQE